MLRGVHVLLTYRCTHECDHCFLHCSPRSEGTFTFLQIERLLNQALATGTVEWIWFEGGEPFLYHPLLYAAVRAASVRGLRIGAVTNGYWAESEADAELWLRPLAEAGLAELGVSEDAFHGAEEDARRARHARAAAERLGITAHAFRLPDPEAGEGVVFRGRAADRLADRVRPRAPATFGAGCPEPLARPERVHVDSFGTVQVCQGISIGNVWETPLVDLLRSYDPGRHPIVGPILDGGPARLAKLCGLPLEDGYASVCHLCYRMRELLLDRYPELLTPPQAYGRPRAPAATPGSQARS
jgi:hypothetical protein